MRSRTPATLRTTLECNLLAYATAASAAGLGILGMTPTAEAEVIFKHADVHIGVYRPYHLDLNGDGVGEVTIGVISATCFSACRVYMFASRENGSDGNVALSIQHHKYATALKRGARIGAKKQFGSYDVLMAATFATSYGLRGISGRWVNAKNRYLGLKYWINGETHFGWARMSVTVQRLEVTGTLTGYAYETTPNRPIIAGDEGTGASLGHVALGAAGKKH